jgi:ribosome-associated protein
MFFIFDVTEPPQSPVGVAGCAQITTIALCDNRCYIRLMDLGKLRGSILKSAQVTYSRSGGPGGQNVNKVNTKVALRIRIDELQGLSELEFERLKTMLASKLSALGTELVIHSSDERLQSVNEENAYRRLEALIVGAVRLPKKRRPTQPTKASEEERLKTKKLQGAKKNNRQTAGYD